MCSRWSRRGTILKIRCDGDKKKRYLIRVNDSAALGDEPEDPGVRAADAMQAAYFRAMLARERDEIDTELEKSRRRLQASMKTGESFELHRQQRWMREHESHRCHLDWMISGLDRRFNSVWSDLAAESD